MDSRSVRMNVQWFVPTGQARPITMALHSLANETRSMRGCLGCSVSTDFADQGAIRYSEEWLSEEDLRERVLTDTFVQLVAMMEEAIDPPHVEFVLGHKTRGLDFVEEVRASLP